MDDLEAHVAEFLSRFEEVFDHDWPHTRFCIGAHLTLEDLFIGKDGTFLQPRVEDEYNDWNSRGALLESYRRLRAELEARRE